MTNPIKKLRDFTNARVALGRSGHSIPTKAHLKFRLDHAEARDAVLLPVDFTQIEAYLTDKKLGFIHLTSKAESREVYLQRPDWGRELNEESRNRLKHIVDESTEFDVALVVEDGLSAQAIHKQIIPFLEGFLPLNEAKGYKLAPISLVEQGRVAIGDEIGSILNSKLVVVLVGERPGLTVPDSLGIYLAYSPKPGMTDESRNCISNVHNGGLSHQMAAAKLMYLIEESVSWKLSGVKLKENFSSENILS